MHAGFVSLSQIAQLAYSRVISGDPWPFLAYLFLDWFDIVTYLEENLAPMYLPKSRETYF